MNSRNEQLRRGARVLLLQAQRDWRELPIPKSAARAANAALRQAVDRILRNSQLNKRAQEKNRCPRNES